jgi:hypothetical protein
VAGSTVAIGLALFRRGGAMCPPTRSATLAIQPRHQRDELESRARECLRHRVSQLENLIQQLLLCIPV